MTALSPEIQLDHIARRRGLILVAPAALWTVVFFLLPTLSILWQSLYEIEGGKVGEAMSIANYRRFAEPALCCTNLLIAGRPLSPDRLIPRPL